MLLSALHAPERAPNLLLLAHHSRSKNPLALQPLIQPPLTMARRHRREDGAPVDADPGVGLRVVALAALVLAELHRQQ